MTWWPIISTLAPVLAGDGVEHAAQAQDHVTPALAAGRAEIELADMLALRRQLRIFVRDAEGCKPVRDAEFLLTQPLVGNHGQHDFRAEALQHGLCGGTGAQVRGVQHDVGLPVGRQGRKPLRQRIGLAQAQFGEGDIDIALGNVDQKLIGSRGSIARHVTGTLAVPHEPDLLRPFLLHRIPFGG